MDCQEFLSSYTDYRDGLLSARDVARMEVHLSGCPSCGRYREVVDEGIRELRSLPAVTTTDDFHPRLQHRIYHVEDGDSFLDHGSRGSGTTAVAAVGIAILLTAAAWTPVLRQAGASVTLPAIVVSQPPGESARADVQLPPSAFFRSADSWRRSSGPRWSPPSSAWTTSETSSASPGIRPSLDAGSGRPPGSVTLNPAGSGTRGFRTQGGITFAPTASQPVFFNASSPGPVSGPVRLGLGLD